MREIVLDTHKKRSKKKKKYIGESERYFSFNKFFQNK